MENPTICISKNYYLTTDRKQCILRLTKLAGSAIVRWMGGLLLSANKKHEEYLLLLVLI